jgi:hypothetical protein
VCSEKIQTRENVAKEGRRNMQMVTTDDPDFPTYFSQEAIVKNGGDIVSQALKYYREVFLVKNGFKLEDSKIISV